jgi:predicted transcriptional regulator
LQSPCFRATVLHETMNVTLKVPDEVCKAARHLAVDASKSLSAWMADLMRREVEARTAKPENPRTWMDAFSGDENDPYLDRDFPIEDRKTMKIREFNFEE